MFLRRFPVPCWAIASVFGREAMYWDRLQQGWGRCSLVGTTVQTAEHFPKDLVAEETQSWLQGPRVSSATTAGRAWILGASVSKSAAHPDLQQAYGVLAHAAHTLEKADAPHTVHTDAGKPRKAPGRPCALTARSSCVFSMPFSKSVTGRHKPCVRSLRRDSNGCGQRLMPRATARFPSVSVA